MLYAHTHMVHVTGGSSTRHFTRAGYHRTRFDVLEERQEQTQKATPSLQRYVWQVDQRRGRQCDLAQPFAREVDQQQWR